MEKITVQSIYELEKNKGIKSYLHFTNSGNMNNINKEGLKPKIGENAMWIEKSEKIFFSEGFEETMKLMDVW